MNKIEYTGVACKKALYTNVIPSIVKLDNYDGFQQNWTCVSLGILLNSSLLPDLSLTKSFFILYIPIGLCPSGVSTVNIQ